jgi:hypothetical protein
MIRPRARARRNYATALAGVLVGVMLLTLQSGCGATAADSPALADASSSPSVYRLQVRWSGGGQAFRWREWIDPAKGAWRIRAGRETFMFDGKLEYAALAPERGLKYVRRGSAKFLGYLRRKPIGMVPLRTYLAGRTTFAGRGRVSVANGQNRVLRVKFPSGKRATIRIEAVLPRTVAEEAGLFTVPIDETTTIDVELAASAPALPPVQAYWFGPTASSLTAVTATQNRTRRTEADLAVGVPPRSEMDLHVTFYELASAGGRSSALPGMEAPDGEVMVVSQPVESAHAQYVIRAFNGQNGDLTEPSWARRSVVLANGEAATVLPDRYGSGGFYVITETTLVSVTGALPGNADPYLAAKLLRPKTQ